MGRGVTQITVDRVTAGKTDEDSRDALAERARPGRGPLARGQAGHMRAPSQHRSHSRSQATVYSVPVGLVHLAYMIQ